MEYQKRGPRGVEFCDLHWLYKRWSSTTPIVTLSQNDRLLIVDQWSRWWAQLVSARETSQRRPLVYDPSHFKLLDNELGNVCRQTWQPFREWWQMPAGGHVAMMFWESAEPVQQYVREFEEEAGRKAKPFRLEVDYVYAGLDNVLEVNVNYAIIPAHSPREHRSWWKQKIRELG